LGELTRAGVIVAQLPVGTYSEQLRRKELARIHVTPELPDVQYFAVYRRATAHRLAGQIAVIAKEVCNFSARAK
jgi:DNA-binding transcriptional LysR family regulator